MKFKGMNINEYGYVSALYITETLDEDGKVIKTENHRIALHVSETENHRYSHIAALFSGAGSYPNPNEEPTTSELDAMQGEIDDKDLELQQLRLAKILRTGEIEIDGDVIKIL